MAAIPSFDEYLEQLEFEEGQDASMIDETLFANPFLAATVPLAWTEALAAAGLNLWEQAFAWLPDSDEAPRPGAARNPETASPPEPKRATPGDDIATIARELGLAEARTPEALHRARRRFMWQNHPDRCPEIPGKLATRRVALANMLVDRALNEIAGRNGGRRNPGGA